ncbi:MAG: hypothetical protein ACRESU_00400, partial [Gammaproteobacteria bacterium]
AYKSARHDKAGSDADSQDTGASPDDTDNGLEPDVLLDAAARTVIDMKQLGVGSLPAEAAAPPDKH